MIKKKKCCGKYDLKGHISMERGVSALNKHEQGDHYKNSKIQAIEFITSHNLDFIDGNIVKYAVRRKKGESNKERYLKIKHYAELALELKNDTA